MLENFSILIQKSGKGRREMPRHFPARLIRHHIVVSSLNACLLRFFMVVRYYLILINKLPSLSLPLGNAKGSPAEGELRFIIV